MPANTSQTRSRRALILGGYAALVVAFLGAGLIPYLYGVASANSSIAKDKQQVADNLRKKGELADVEKRIEMLKKQVAYYPRLVPENQELGAFLTQLSEELGKAQLKNIDHKALTSITMGKTQKLPIELRGTGTFKEFRTFLVNLEHLERMCTVSKLSLEADQEMTGKVNVELTLFIYNTKPS